MSNIKLSGDDILGMVLTKEKVVALRPQLEQMGAISWWGEGRLDQWVFDHIHSEDKLYKSFRDYYNVEISKSESK